MKKSPAARNPEKTPNNDAPKPKNSSLDAEEESAAAHAEPMGSIAAAVPGSDTIAQDAIRSEQLPGREAPEIRDQPQTTAGTEAKLEDE